LARKKQTGTSRPILHFCASIALLALLAAASYLILATPRLKDGPSEPPKRPVRSHVEMQIALAREGFSPGSIDGIEGTQSRQALAAFQNAHQIPSSGILDEATLALLQIAEPTHARAMISEAMLQAIDPKPESWIERGTRPRMAYNSLLELIAERSKAHPDYLLELNPKTDWQRLRPGDQVLVPLVPDFRIEGIVDHVRIRLSERSLQAVDRDGRVLFHCPVSIARNVEKRPIGELRVEVKVADPNYTFNPAILTAAAAREGITEKFIVQPGPNNPVGSVWIGLNRPSYGIHGTPEPEKVGRTESSGCFRLANWNAETLLGALQPGSRIIVEP
jgi:lipoprotein-anchoring transpeptidase ErfK/SrfK